MYQYYDGANRPEKIVFDNFNSIFLGELDGILL